MTLSNVTREGVLAAMRECDELGREAFLGKYGFGAARDYVLVHDGNRYDSKAIAGVAHSFEHPGASVLTSSAFTGGEPVARVLENLGFEVERPDGPNPRAERVWLIRAGSEGAQESLALEESVALIGWSVLGEFAPGISRNELKDLIGTTFSEKRPQSLASQAGQIYRFMNEVKVDDLVVLPLKTHPQHVAVGRIRGPYRYRDDGPFRDADGRHTRAVEWIEPDLPFERFDPDLRDAFGQQGTISEITKRDAAARITDVLEGVDASAIHLVLKWAPALEPRTIDHHREVADQRGSVWWGRLSKPGATGLSADRLKKVKQQLQTGSVTNVYLHSAAGTWRTRLLAITTDRADVDESLVPPYYGPDSHHSLWVQVTDFEQIEPTELTENYVLAQSGEPLTLGALGNQTPVIIRRQSLATPVQHFILNQAAPGRAPYEDEEGASYHWTEKSSGAWKQLANSEGARFIYYRPGTADDGSARTYFASGRIGGVEKERREDGLQHFAARIDEFLLFDTPVPWDSGPARNAQTSIQPITRAQFEKLVAQGMNEPLRESCRLRPLRGWGHVRHFEEVPAGAS